MSTSVLHVYVSSKNHDFWSIKTRPHTHIVLMIPWLKHVFQHLCTRKTKFCFFEGWAWALLPYMYTSEAKIMIFGLPRLDHTHMSSSWYHHWNMYFNISALEKLKKKNSEGWVWAACASLQVYVWSKNIEHFKIPKLEHSSMSLCRLHHFTDILWSLIWWYNY